MVTTFPDNLWSPNAGDPYNLTTDLASMQSSVQTALTERKKAYRADLTNAQRLALSGADLFSGLRVFTTDTQQNWLYTVGGWVWAGAVDTAWIQVTSFQNSFSASTDSPVYYCRRNGIVHFKGDLKRSSAPGGLTAFILPSGFRPGSTARLAGRTDVGMGLIVSTAGEVLISASVAQAPGGGSGYALAGHSFLAE